MPVLGAQGNLIRFLHNPVTYMRRLYETYGEIASLAEGATETIFIFAPKYNQQVLSNATLFYSLDAEASPMRLPARSAAARLFTGLTQMNGSKHRQHRQLMLPAFHKKRIIAYRDDIVSLTERKVGSWRADQEFDILHEIRELTLSIAVKILIGLDPDREGEAIFDLLDRWLRLVFSIPTLLLPFDLPGLPYRRLLALSEHLEGEIRVMIDRKRTSVIDQGDVLSMLLQVHDEDGAQLTDDELVGQTATLFVAGHEITARVLTWTLFLLSQHPRVMADVQDELKGQLHAAPAAVEQLPQLPLLDGVIKESMRLLPPMIWWSRLATAPTDLGGYPLPEGAKVIFSPFMTHRLPHLYPKPDKFLPERWLTIRPGPYEYIPFSAGPRMCLGAPLALMEMKLVLTTLLQRHSLALHPRVKLDFGGVMLSEPKQRLPMVVRPRDCRVSASHVRGSIRSIVDLESPL
jgi:cytochrome P450